LSFSLSSIATVESSGVFPTQIGYFYKVNGNKFRQTLEKQTTAITKIKDGKIMKLKSAN
jgi:hypothetical protein